MTTMDKLQEEFNCAVTAVLGDFLDKEYQEGDICKEDLIAIANKMAFYLNIK